MITLISKSIGEQSTDDVMDWLLFKNQTPERVNGADFLENNFAVTLTNYGKEFSSTQKSTINNLFNLNKKNFLWFRRWYDASCIKPKNGSATHSNEQDKIGIAVALNNHIKTEMMVFSDWILDHLHQNNLALNNYRHSNLNKLKVLEQASRVGLNIPPTLITNSKHELHNFFISHSRIISKALGENMTYFSGQKQGHSTMMYTEEITPEFINKLPKQFGISLFQKLLEKEFELRIFYLNNKFYSMAIFSQLNPKTKVDFRRYDYKNANRCVPFILPKEIEKKLRQLLERMTLQSASIDMVYTCDDKYVFLEVNPEGQFGMVSKPCNYYLEEKIADFLIKKQQTYEK